VSASHCPTTDVYSDFTIPVFGSPSVVDSVTSGTYLQSRCLAVAICVTLYIHAAETDSWSSNKVKSYLKWNPLETFLQTIFTEYALLPETEITSQQ
jgi:uncharacterized membrane protein